MQENEIKSKMYRLHKFSIDINNKQNKTPERRKKKRREKETVRARKTFNPVYINIFANLYVFCTILCII